MTVPAGVYEAIVVSELGVRTAAMPGQKEPLGQTEGRIVPAVVTAKAYPGRMSVQIAAT